MQTITDFWRVYGGVTFAVLASIAAFVIWARLSITKLEGKVSALEKQVEAHSSCIKALQSKEVDEKLREYKAEESAKKLDALARAVSEGFARIDGALGQQALQNVQIIGDLGNLKKSNEKAWEKLDKHEKALIALGVEVDEP